jgi:glycosyltransferase involved in cell wall biosynthesis
MATQYRGAHATVCCFADGFGKSCPNSVVEGLACGRPAIVSETVGIANLIHDHNAGVMIPRTVEGLIRGVERLRRQIDPMSRAARALAEQTFGMSQFLNTYQRLYDVVRATRAPATPADVAQPFRVAVRGRSAGLKACAATDRQ